jgi:hypothetical protein
MKLQELAGIVTHDLKNKGIALFFAVTIWYFAWNNQITVSESRACTLLVKLETSRSSGDEWEIVKLWSAREHEPELEERESINVKLAVTGPQQDVGAFNPAKWERELSIRPEDCYPNEGYLIGQERLTGRMFLPDVRSLRVVEDTIVPNVIRFQLSRIVTKKLPVAAPALRGRPPAPLRFSAAREPEIDPPTLNVRGAEFYLPAPRCRIVTDDLTLESVSAQELSYSAKVAARLEYPKEALNPPVLVDENGRPLANQTPEVSIRVFFEPEPTESRQMEVSLWAKLPLAGQGERPVAVKCDRARVTVRFVGTKQDIETIAGNKDKPEFGLYFVVDPTKKPGEPWAIALTDFKWDQTLIPGTVRLQEADAAPGGAKGTGTVFYTLIPTTAKDE